MRKVTEFEAMSISKEHRNAIRNYVDEDGADQAWYGKAFGIESTLQMLGIRFDIEADGSLSFKDVER